MDYDATTYEQSAVGTERYILVIDDELSMQSEWLGSLLVLERRIKAVTGPDAAVSFCNEHGKDIDLIILDIVMPPESFADKDTSLGQRTGVVLWRDILKYNRCPNAGVLVVSALHRSELEQEFSGYDVRFMCKRTITDMDREIVSEADSMLDSVTPLGRAQNAVRRIKALRRGWDGMSAAVINNELADAALDMMVELIQRGISELSIVPTKSGSVRIEGVYKIGYLVVDVTSPVRVVVSRISDDCVTQFEGQVSPSIFALIADAAKSLEEESSDEQ